MSSPDTHPPRLVRPDDLALWEHIPGVAAVARDGSLRAIWCNASYAALCKRAPADLLGTRMRDLMPVAAAEEREAQLRAVIASGRAATYIQFGADTRLLCAARPLDEAAFGHPGVLTTIQEAPHGVLNGIGHQLGNGAGPREPTTTVLRIPCLAGLGVLSPRELEVLYYLATGASTAGIAEDLHRSAKTIDKHIESIHRKLRTTSRAEIVRLGVEKGIDCFTADEWLAIVEGSKAARPVTTPIGPDHDHPAARDTDRTGET